MRIHAPKHGLLWAMLALLASCAPLGPPRAPSSSRPPSAPAPRWQPVPARADGAVVPGGRRHIVKRGETGLAIAKAYGVPWNRIATANRIARDATIYVGQPLFIPTAPPQGQAGRPPTPEERAAAFRLDVDDLVTGSSPAAASRPPAPSPGAGSSGTGATPPKPAVAGIPQLSWPVEGRVILSRYGPKAGGRVNDGINIKARAGETVRAASAGEVIYVGDAIAGFGLMLLLRHPGGIVTAYAHLEDALVDRGEKVARGQPVARAGASGGATEPQLHFELRQGRQTLDPLLYLPR